MVDERGSNQFSTSPACGGQASWPHPKDFGDGNGGWVLSSQYHIETVTLYNLHGKSTPLWGLYCYFSLFFSSMELLATSSNLSKVGLLIQSFSLLSTTDMNMLLPSSAITNLKKKIQLALFAPCPMSQECNIDTTFFSWFFSWWTDFLLFLIAELHEGSFFSLILLF